ncbi:LacI family transcriptional regulator [Aquimarina sp. MAR_2010_214]|uniref:LacI family DNA-binding transcriptional regulator n=1 Tax=Aquimarina sp. MAR_2010_214 TaxID=1250026 RepID=UPI000C705699|nr:LacI family DNA-binding transcriptional regulator [Aquimarina sp. MAR_2010_214]PKV51142.1 LacI family transcriptional regulator [Aquimarina sp. MAR_2010_214]
MKKRVTLKDISKISGFSVSTISKALHDDADISYKTKTKVKKLASIYNYVPNFLAKYLKYEIPNIIGVSVPKNGEFDIPKIVKEITCIPLLKKCELVNYQLEDNKVNVDVRMQNIIEGDIAGIIVLFSNKARD